MYTYLKAESFDIDKRIHDLEGDAYGILAGASSSNSAMTMGRKIRDLHGLLSFAVSDFQKEINNLDKMFNPRFIAPDKAELNKVLKSVVDTIKTTAHTANDEFRQAAYERSMKMVAVAPSQEQLNLLSALRMRTDISQAELQMIGTAVSENYQATRVVKDIAKAHGCSMTTPLLNVEDVHALIEETHTYLDSAIECTDMTDVPMGKRFFFRINKNDPDMIGDPHFTDAAMQLDGSPELNAVTVKKEFLNASEQAKVDYYFRSLNNLSDATDKENFFDNLIVEHSQDIGLLRMSEYAGDVQNAEKKRASTIDPADTGSRRFVNMPTLISYIRHETQGLEGEKYIRKVDSILNTCPKQHRYAWDYFNTYGEMPTWDNQTMADE